MTSSNIGKRIKEKRNELGLTLENVASVSGVSRQTIQRYESGVIKNIPSERIENIAKALRTTPDYLMGWSDLDSFVRPKAPNSYLIGQPSTDRMLKENGGRYYNHQGHYLDPEVAEIAQELYDRPELKALFSTMKKLSKEDLETITKLINKFAANKE
ncbi:MAG: helix-turn-helix transcriptional regulator [Peptostreptococcaceae bacterium]|nr:helix-turn-helix transcriptional regulator [Peptostreptococcaceae bacterium]